MGLGREGGEWGMLGRQCLRGLGDFEDDRRKQVGGSLKVYPRASYRCGSPFEPKGEGSSRSKAGPQALRPASLPLPRAYLLLKTLL